MYAWAWKSASTLIFGVWSNNRNLEALIYALIEKRFYGELGTSRKIRAKKPFV